MPKYTINELQIDGEIDSKSRVLTGRVLARSFPHPKPGDLLLQAGVNIGPLQTVRVKSKDATSAIEAKIGNVPQ